MYSNSYSCNCDRLTVHIVHVIESKIYKYMIKDMIKDVHFGTTSFVNYGEVVHSSEAQNTFTSVGN